MGQIRAKAIKASGKGHLVCVYDQSISESLPQGVARLRKVRKN